VNPVSRLLPSQASLARSENRFWLLRRVTPDKRSTDSQNDPTRKLLPDQVIDTPMQADDS